ncbi:MAG TPA: hypothetical protein VN283_00270 [Thiobacillus sp.]|nr:hypothetical protein [Thiobacillus sp.]
MGYDFAKFKGQITTHTFSEGVALPFDLQLWRGQSGAQSIYYAPFEHQNAAPKVALIGITPGHTQAVKALQAAQAALRRGDSDEKCLVAAKIHASFGGDMRNDLVDMLDTLGINALIGEDTTGNLWTEAGYTKGQFCSMLQYPTFQGSKNFNAVPSTRKSEAFREMLERAAETLNNLPRESVVLPLGKTVTKALVKLRKEGLLKRNLLEVAGEPICVPHPSGENSESVRLVLNWHHENAQEYAEECHARYLNEKPWLKKGRSTPLPPQEYKAARETRWRDVHRLREHFGLT